MQSQTCNSRQISSKSILTYKRHACSLELTTACTYQRDLTSLLFFLIGRESGASILEKFNWVFVDTPLLLPIKHCCFKKPRRLFSALLRNYVSLIQILTWISIPNVTIWIYALLFSLNWVVFVEKGDEVGGSFWHTVEYLTIIGQGWAKYRDLTVPKPKAEANNWSARHWQVTIFCDNWVQ